MTSTNTLIYTNLPPPEVIETYEYEEILAQLMEDARQRFLNAGIDYDLGNLEVDPVKIILEAVAYREVLTRGRVNDAAMANLVPFAEGGDLDQLASFYDVVRLTGETDEALRVRIIENIQGRSTAGPKDWYEAAARRADVRIRDVRAYREQDYPIIHIALLSTEGGGVPDQTMIDNVTNEINKTDVRVLNDTDIVIESAIAQTVDVSADIYLTPNAPQSVFDELEQTLRDAWDAETSIGFDLDPSWIASRLHPEGVKAVENLIPNSRVVAADNDAIALGTITLTFAGTRF